jgi:hypothetical protein
MARRTRKRRLRKALCVTSLATGTVLATASLPAAHAETVTAASSVTVRPDPSNKQERFQGWGTSLVWFANATGDYPAEIREKLAQLLFDDDGLALNIARYNIGGGNAPDVKDYLRPGAAVEGWWKAPAGTTREDTDWWDAKDPAAWKRSADATQRWWVERIKNDIDHWEAFSNSPPTWWAPPSGLRRRTASRSAPSIRSTSPTPATGALSSERTASRSAGVRRAPTWARNSSRR